MQQIVVGGYTVEIVRKNIRNLNLRVCPPDGRVRVSAPLRLGEEAIRQFVSSKLGWIRKHAEQFKDRERFAPKEYESGESHWLAGQKYLLNVITDSCYNHIDIRDGFFDLYVKPGTDREKRGELLNEWYRAILKGKIEPLISKWQRIMGVQVKEWSIRQMKTKWGTCNITAKRVWINLELAKKPEPCLEYIIVHELLHLIVKNHDAAFKARMDRLLPDWKLRNKELRTLQ